MPGEYAVHVCSGCGAGVTQPPASAEELAAAYPDTYGPHRDDGPLGGRLGRALAAREVRVGAAGALGAGGGARMRDAGCGDGETGGMLVARGWRVDGLDISESACELARDRGVDARPGSIETAELPAGAYGAVLFNHSLEHVVDPVGALARAREALEPSGRVAVSAPNFGCWARRRFGGAWFHLDLPRHRIHFTAGALGAAMERAGLRAERVWTTTSPSGLAGSVQYRRLGGLAVAEGPARRASGQLAGLALIPVARAEQALGGGRDFLHAVARAAP